MEFSAFSVYDLEDKELVTKFEKVVKNSGIPVYFRECDFPAKSDSDWEKSCEMRIMYSSFVVCMLGKNTYTDEKVEKIISKAAKMNKPVMAVNMIAEVPLLPFSLTELDITPTSVDIREFFKEAVRIMEDTKDAVELKPKTKDKSEEEDFKEDF